ncbi:MAG TPA: hypothetical protein PKJ23_08380, partial [bacterium]|nr:hypothetical protein [bacterium]
PTNTPTDIPTNTPTYTPTYTPTDTPTEIPTDTPTNTPTDIPTDTPTVTPTNTPTSTPADTPTPTVTPTLPPVSTPVPPPVITISYGGKPVSPTTAIGGRVENRINLTVNATDPGWPSVTLSLLSGPAGSSFLSFADQGVFSWVPSATQVGDFQSVFLAQNAGLSTGTASAKFRIFRSPRRIIANPGNFVAIGFTNHTNPQVWSQVFNPLTGLRLGGGKLIDGYLYAEYAYPQWDRFLTMDFDGDGTHELVTADITEEGTVKTWISVRDLMTGTKIRPSFRVLEDPAYQSPQWTECMPADVDNDGDMELLVTGVATLGGVSWRNYLQTWEPETGIRLKTIRLLFDSAFDYTNPAWHHNMVADVNADGTDELLSVGVTNETPPRTYCQVRNPLNHFQKFSFRILSSAEFSLPLLNQFLAGNVDSDPNDELVAIGVTNETVKRTWVQVWNPNSGVLKYGGLKLLDSAEFAYPEGNRFVLADGDGDGKKELLAIGITNEARGRIWVQRWDLANRVKLGGSIVLLNDPAFEDPSLSEYFAMDADLDGDDELIATGYARANNAFWVQVWDLNPMQLKKTFRVLNDTSFAHPVYNSWTGG